MTIPVILSVAAVVLAVVNLINICLLLNSLNRQKKRRAEFMKELDAVLEKWKQQEIARRQQQQK